MRILIVEDDPDIASFIEDGLREASYSVMLVTDGIAGIREASTSDFDLIVLDLMLPRRDGFSVLRTIREQGIQTPVICLTARNTVDDRVRGLDLGADDYLAKPFSFCELLARIRALLRRPQGLEVNPIVIGALIVDLHSRAVSRGDQSIDLSPNEFALLEYLVRNRDQVLSRTMILSRVWGMNQDPTTNLVDVQINRLRKKVDRGFHPPLIQTIRGVGYVLRVPADAPVVDAAAGSAVASAGGSADERADEPADEMV